MMIQAIDPGGGARPNVLGHLDSDQGTAAGADPGPAGAPAAHGAVVARAPTQLRRIRLLMSDVHAAVRGGGLARSNHPTAVQERGCSDRGRQPSAPGPSTASSNSPPRRPRLPQPRNCRLCMLLIGGEPTRPNLEAPPPA